MHPTAFAEPVHNHDSVLCDLVATRLQTFDKAVTYTCVYINVMFDITELTSMSPQLSHVPMLHCMQGNLGMAGKVATPLKT